MEQGPTKMLKLVLLDVLLTVVRDGEEKDIESRLLHNGWQNVFTQSDWLVSHFQIGF